MKTIIVLLGVVALSLGAAVPEAKEQPRTPCNHQDEINDILRYVAQPQCNSCSKNTFTPENNRDQYEKPEYVEELMHSLRHFALPQGEIFSVYDVDHLKQAIALFNLMYSANTTQTFLNTSCFARNNINEGIFVYSFSVAVLHRRDTAECKLPVIYKTNPFYFFNTEIIYKAQRYKQQYQGTGTPEPSLECSIDDTHSGSPLSLHDEQVVSYFTEDIDMNRYYWDYNIRYPFWMGSKHIAKEERRGELYYYFHQQLLARYYLERLSNDVGVIPLLDVTSPIEPGFRPSLQYPNGLTFPERPGHMLLKNHVDHNHPYYSNYSRAYDYLRDYPRRIRDATDLGYAYDRKGEKVKLYGDEGFEILSHMLEGNPDSPNRHYYGDLQRYARHYFGHTRFPYGRKGRAPSALEHFETSLRDPIFYQMYQQLVFYFQDYKMHLPPYSRDDLILDNVEITKFEALGKIVTKFEKVCTDLSYGVFYDDKKCPNDQFKVGGRQQRLNYETFILSLRVKSDRNVDSVVRIFIGPKYDEHGRMIDVNENRMNFFEFDSFQYNLVSGFNDITRTSQQAQHPIGHTSWGFPKRIMIPKGKVGGQTFQMYLIISKRNSYKHGVRSANYVDNRPMGFPFDRQIDTSVFDVPNAIMKDMIIYHGEEKDNRTT